MDKFKPHTAPRLAVSLTAEDNRLLNECKAKMEARAGAALSMAAVIRSGIQALARVEGVVPSQGA